MEITIPEMTFFIPMNNNAIILYCVAAWYVLAAMLIKALAILRDDVRNVGKDGGPPLVLFWTVSPIVFLVMVSWFINRLLTGPSRS